MARSGHAANDATNDTGEGITVYDLLKLVMKT